MEANNTQQIIKINVCKKRNFLWELLHMKPQLIGQGRKENKLEMVEI